jgi:hypothetical protein
MGGQKQASVLCLSVLCVASVLCGCNSDAGATKTASLPVEAQIKQIQDDPKMPPGAKEAAIASLRQHQVIGSVMQQTIKK